MKNPCSKCLVQACCSKVCHKKEKFVDLCLRDLTTFTDNYLYDKKNQRLFDLDPSLNSEHNRLIAICEMNQGDISAIVKRGLS